MAGINLSGLISGMDTDTVIEKLMEIENQRITLQENRKTVLETKQTAWQDVRTSLSTLRSKLDAIRFTSIYRSRKATLSDDTVATVTANAGATLTTHRLEVKRLATAHVVAGSFQDAPTAQLNQTGGFAINGQWIGVVATDNLYSIRDKINAAEDAGVQADVVQVANNGQTQYRLVLTAKKTGTDGQIDMGAGSSSPTAVDATGTTATGNWQVKVTQLAQVQAVATKDGLSATQKFAGSFTITTDTDSYEVDLGAGKTLAEIADLINNAQSEVTATFDEATGKLSLSGAGFSLTHDSGVVQELGLLDNATWTRSATYTVNGTAYTSTAGNSITDAGGVAGLNLVLNEATSEAVTVANGAAQGLGFLNASGGFAQELVTAQNADFYLDGVHYDNKSSNIIADVLPNLTITLKRGGATSTDPDATLATDIAISTDADKVATAVQDWVTALNESMELLGDLTSYNTETKQAGALQGDYLARNLQTGLRKMLSNVVEGLPTGLRQLSDIGITTGQYGTDDYGKVVFDSEKFKTKLTDDAEGVARVLGALQRNAALASNGGTVEASSVMAADGEHVYAAEDVINGETSSSRFGTAGGGWASASAPDPNAVPPTTEWLAVSFAQSTVDQVQLSFPEDSNILSYRIQYWDLPSSTWKTVSETKTHDGSTFKSFDFDPVVTTKMRLEVTATKDNGPVRGVSEFQVLQQNNGSAVSMYRYVNSSLGVEGALENRDDSLSEQIEDLDDQITKMTDQLAAKEQSLREQFERMEAALAELRTQSSMLSGQLGSLSGS